jgi:hypothetical protein
METILGAGNGIVNYLLVLFIYFLFFLLIKYPKPVVELNYRGNFYFLAVVWFILMFTGNYFFHLLGLMSFLPWLNNFIHSAIWIGLCLTWLYYCSHKRPMLEQFIFFAFTSFIVKMAEHMLLGSWSMDGYFGINHPLAYLIAMSLVDGFYPIISKFLIQWMAKLGKFGVYAAEE